MRRVDLHNHSWYSDGITSPADVVRQATAKRVDAIALTDHDCILGLLEATEEGKRIGVEVIPGIEIDATIQKTDVHILGYGFNPTHPGLVATLTRFQQERHERLEGMVRLFNEMSGEPPLDFERDVRPEFKGVGMIPHLINCLAKRGYDPVKTRKTWFSNGKPCYIPRGYEYTTAEAIRLVHDAGGVAVLAHPFEYFPDQDGSVLFPFVEQLVAQGLDGVEVFYAYDLNGRIWGKTRIVGWEPEKRAMEEFCRARDLLMTGGGDWHGRGDVMGCLDLSYELVDRIRSRCR